jgi:MerR family transcriptional regulator, copper efflux regulator
MIDSGLYSRVKGAIMLIGKLAKESGLSIDTIRFYEKKGLIDSALIKRRSNNYREYSDDSVERLGLVQLFKRLGFTLAEIKEGLEPFISGQLTVEHKQNLLSRKIEQVEERIQELKKIAIYLSEKLDLLGLRQE